MTSAIKLYADTITAVKDLDVSQKDQILAMTKSAYSTLVAALEMDDMASAIDTFEKTKLIEDYVKRLVKQQKLDVLTQNQVVKNRYDMAREIGWWLDENTVSQSVKSPNERIRKTKDGKTKFYWDEIGMHHEVGYKYIKISDIPIHDYEKLFSPYLFGTNGDDPQELWWTKMWGILFPIINTYREVLDLDFDISKKGEAVYKNLRKVGGSLESYFTYLGKKEVDNREYLFMANKMKQYAIGLLSTADKLIEHTGVYLDESEEAGKSRDINQPN